MKVIHLLRKPCSEGTVAANVLRWGTGALNIDGTRVSSDDGFEKAWEKPVRTNIGAKGGAYITEGVQHTVDLSANRPVGGRWPANLVLQHLPECEQTGTREEAGYTVNRFTDGMKPFGEGAGHPYESVTVPPSTVAVWSCAHGCPVTALDAQSGVSKTPTKVTRGAGGQHGTYSPIGAQGEIPSYGDTGGASRYFKQFGG